MDLARVLTSEEVQRKGWAMVAPDQAQAKVLPVPPGPPGLHLQAACPGRLPFCPTTLSKVNRPQVPKKRLSLRYLPGRAGSAECRFWCPPCTVQSPRAAGRVDPASSRPPVPGRLLLRLLPLFCDSSLPPASVQLLTALSLIVWGANFRISI